jgi:TldD protein
VNRALTLLAAAALAAPALGQAPAAPAREDDAILQAMVDEQQRSLDMQLQDLGKPYFLQYVVDDSQQATVSAAFGAVEGSYEMHGRMLGTSVRVGSPQLDNTNFSGDSGFMSFFGGFAQLPVDDDPIAMRDALWTATDGAYKSAVETLTKKKAYMADKKLEDRPADFSAAPATRHIEPLAKFAFDRPGWEGRMAQITQRFRQHSSIQESSASLSAGATNHYLVNTEGTRLRTARQRATLEIDASTQAEDGMRISDKLSYVAETADALPPVDKILADIDALVGRMEALAKAPILDHYAGPVLFDGQAAPAVFRTLLAGGLAARPEPVGSQRGAGLGGGKGLEKKLGTRILPDSFHVWDDPTVERLGDKLLDGHYAFDDEGVAAAKVDLVVGGKLQGLCLGRTPTKKLSGSNGHGRAASAGSQPQANIANVFIADARGLAPDALKAALIKAATDAGLEYGVRVAAPRTAGNDRSSMFSFFMGGQGGGTKLTDPLYAWKVYVSDGHEELIRGAEFAMADDSVLKHILAAGQQGFADGGSEDRFSMMFGGAGGGCVIAPAVLFEELELSKIEQENDKLPYLPMPQLRKGS